MEMGYLKFYEATIDEMLNGNILLLLLLLYTTINRQVNIVTYGYVFGCIYFFSRNTFIFREYNKYLLYFVNNLSLE